jgi:hypothetical protein
MKMKANHVKTAVLASLLVLAGLAVIFLPAYAGEPEPSARPAPKLHRVYKAKIDRPEPKLQGTYEPELITRPEPNKYTLQGGYKVELHRDDLIAKEKLEEECGAAIAMGYSESFSFDEAFRNAIDALPEDTTPVYPDKMTGVRVIEIGATFGGITGVAHMYVRVQRAPDPSCLAAKERQEEESRDEKIRRRRGELKKLPGREIELGEVSTPKPIEEK